MNKRTIALTTEQYKEIIQTIHNYYNIKERESYTSSP